MFYRSVLTLNVREIGQYSRSSSTVWMVFRNVLWYLLRTMSCWSRILRSNKDHQVLGHLQVVVQRQSNHWEKMSKDPNIQHQKFKRFDYSSIGALYQLHVLFCKATSAHSRMQAFASHTDILNSQKIFFASAAILHSCYTLWDCCMQGMKEADLNEY